MYEHYSQPLISRSEFIKRQANHFVVAAIIIVGSLFIGIAGYHWLEGLSWLDSLLNASMILGGMGPVNPIQTSAGKLFASFYALYSGMIFLIVVGIMIAPAFHRFLHKFHFEENKDSE